MRGNPYVGPRPFRRGEKLYGRDREAWELFCLLAAERVVVFYAPSGAGKTSLIEAALIPRLENEGFRVARLPQLPAVDPEDPKLNPCKVSLAKGLQEVCGSGCVRLEPSLSVSELLESYEEQALNAQGRVDVVYILDQFEEALRYRHRRMEEAKREFLSELGQALQDRRRWALFSLREEYAARFDNYVQYFPTRLSVTFRLDLLTRDAAGHAITGPLPEGVSFEVEALEALLDDLCALDEPEAGSKAELGLFVEPLHLQVVCRRLWQTLPQGATTIGLNHFAQGFSSLSQALEQYYNSQVRRIAGANTPQGIRVERAIRDWFEQQLIYDGRSRAQTTIGPELESDLKEKALQGLERSCLIRSEEKRGALWHELSHRRLIRSVLESNYRWKGRNLNEFQLAAEEWSRQGRPPELLLRGPRLKRFRDWVKPSRENLEPFERDFLHACLHQRHERRRTRRYRLALLGVILASLALIAWGWKIADEQLFHAGLRERIQRQSVLSYSTLLRSQGQSAQHNLPQALLLAAQAFKFKSDALAQVVSYPRRDERGALATQLPADNLFRSRLQELLRQGDFSIPLHGHRGEVVRAVAFSPDGRLLASGGSDRAVRLWRLNRETETVSGQPPLRHDSVIRALTFIDDRSFVSGDSGGKLRLWALRESGQRFRVKEPMQDLRAHRGNVRALAVEAASGLLASAGDDGLVRLWRLGDFARGEAKPTAQLQGFTGAVRTVSFSKDGFLLAAGGDDGRILLWRRDESKQWQRLPRELNANTESGRAQIRGLTFLDDARKLLSAGALISRGRPSPFSETHSDVGDLALWDLRPDAPGAAPIHRTSYFSIVRSVAAISRMPPVFACTSDGEIFSLHFTPNFTSFRVGHKKAGHHGWIFSLSADPRSRYLASAGQDSTVRLWDLERQSLETPRIEVEDWVRAKVSGKWLAAALNNGNVRIWRMPEVIPSAADSMAASRILAGHTGQVYSIGFWPKRSDWLVSGGADGTIRLWNLNDAESEGCVIGRHEVLVWSIEFSPEGHWLASAGPDAVRLWDLRGKEPGDCSNGFGAAVALRSGMVVRSVAFINTEGGLAIAAGGHGRDSNKSGGRQRNGLIRLWRLQDSEIAPGMEVSPERSQLLSFSNNKGDIDEILDSFPFVSLAYSRRWETLAAAAWDGAVRLWRVPAALPSKATAAARKDDREILPLSILRAEAGAGEAHVVAFVPREESLLTGHRYGKVLQWELSKLLIQDPGSLAGEAGDGQGLARSYLVPEPVEIGAHGSKNGKSRSNWVLSVDIDAQRGLIVSGGQDKSIRFWRSTENLADLACRRAARNLSKPEWTQLVAREEPYQTTCP